MVSKSHLLTQKFYWNTRRIAFSAVLIAVTVVITIISISLNPLFALPTFKLPIIGLPVKVTAYLFGPIIGILVATVGDLITFVMVPTFYHPLYTLSLIVTALISGMVGIYFRSLAKRITINFSKEDLEAKLSLLTANLMFSSKSGILKAKLNKITSWDSFKLKTKKTQSIFNHFLVATLFCCLLGASMIIGFGIGVEEHYFENTFFKTQSFFIFFGSLGIFSMALVLVLIALLSKFSKFRILQKKFLKFMPIIALSALLEFVGYFVVSLADSKVFGGDFLTLMIPHVAFAPLKIWFNLIVISISISVVEPILRKRNWLEARA